MFWIAKFIAGLFGWDISKVQRWVIIGTLVLVGIIITVLGLWLRSCVRTRRAKISEASIQKINKANDAERKAELEKVINDNADVIKTVDERKTLAEAHEAERDAAIWAKIQDADEKIVAAKAQGHDVTSEELHCILVPGDCK